MKTAKARVTPTGKTTEVTLKWVLEFIERPLAEFRPGDWMNLGDDFLTYFGFSPEQVIPQNMAPLQKLQKRVRDRLIEVACHRFLTPLQSLESESQEVRFFRVSDKDEKTGLSLPSDIGDIGLCFYKNGQWQLEVYGAKGPVSLEVNFMMTLAFTLVALQERGRLNDLRACKGCEKLFLAEHGRQQFCSPKCKGRDTSQRFRSRHKEELRVKAHAHYERKVKEKLGPHQKVSQRRKTRTAKAEG